MRPIAKRKAVFVAFLCLAGSTGCGTGGNFESIPSEQLSAALNRTFPQTSEDEFFEAVEKVLVYADPDDTSTNRYDNQITAIRKLLTVADVLYGSYTWTIKVEPNGDGVSASVSTQYLANFNDDAPHPFANRHMGLGTAGMELFWSRVGYFLGMGNNWQTCDEVDNALRGESNPTIAFTGALCGDRAEDLDPRIQTLN